MEVQGGRRAPDPPRPAVGAAVRPVPDSPAPQRATDDQEVGASAAQGLGT